MAFKKSYVVSDEKVVNSFGFAVNTAGIRLDNAKKNCPAFYDHATWEVPLGHWENFRIDNGRLMADLIIEGESAEEKEYIRKIENGDLKGASIGADPIKWNNDDSVLLKGQTAPLLEECDLFEISITPLPGNTNALCLKHEGSMIRLNSNNNKNIIPELKTKTDMKSIALKLGLSETATENEILSAIASIQLSNTQATTFRDNVLKGAEEGLSEDQKGIFLTLSKTDPAQALKFVQLSKTTTEEEVVEGAETVTTTPAKTTVVKDVKVSTMLRKPVAAASADGKDTYDYLQKHNAVELARIHTEEPEKYQQLAADYQKGIRYKA
jgi:HK97 family phage prohead protease